MATTIAIQSTSLRPAFEGQGAPYSCPITGGLIALSNIPHPNPPRKLGGRKAPPVQGMGAPSTVCPSGIAPRGLIGAVWAVCVAYYQATGVWPTPKAITPTMKALLGSRFNQQNLNIEAGYVAAWHGAPMVGTEPIEGLLPLCLEAPAKAPSKAPAKAPAAKAPAKEAATK